MLADKHIRLAAYFIGEEIRRRRQFGHSIPHALHDLDAALNCALSADGKESQPSLSRLKTTTELATEWGCTARTVRNKAIAAGGRKIDGRWIFEEDT